MAFSRKEFFEHFVGTAVIVTATPIACYQMARGANRTNEIRQGLIGQVTSPPIHRLPEPSAARAVAPQENPPETPEQQAERMTMLFRSLFEHLGIGESNDLKRDTDGLTFDERMKQRGSRVYPKMLPSRQVLQTDRPLRTFDFPATDAQEVLEFAIKENSQFPVDAEVRVFHASGTMDFFAARWQSIEDKRWVFTHANTQ